MKHKLKISVSKTPKDGVVSCKKVKVREKLMTKLFGPIRTITILVPGETVNEIAIEEKKEDEPNGRGKQTRDTKC